MVVGSKGIRHLGTRTIDGACSGAGIGKVAVVAIILMSTSQYGQLFV